MSRPSTILEIDGSMGEGGGQVLRSSLSLAVATRRPVRIDNIRAGRAKPGLMRQHLTSARAAAAICDAGIDGDAIGSRTLVFKPGSIQAGSYEFAVGSAGSCLLVLQTILPPLMLADGPSELVLAGGTHNPAAPPYELIERAWLPRLEQMGATIAARIERCGFMPAGGGRVVLEITPGPARPFEAVGRGETLRRTVEAVYANLATDIAQRELALVGDRLGLADEDRKMRQVKADGAGNAVVITIQNAAGTEVVASFGAPGISAERVAEIAARQARDFCASEAAIGKHLADQLLVPMALLGGGRFTTLKPSRHTVTNADVIGLFRPGGVRIDADPDNANLFTITVAGQGDDE